VGSVLIDGSASVDMVGEVFGRLAQYAQLHFADEEKLMAQAGLCGQFVRVHHHHHQQFVDQLNGMWKRRAELGNPAEVLHGFLSSWLSFHILEEDQAMARQIARIGKGTTAVQAWEQEKEPADNSSAVLLAAMRTLYQVLALQNKALSDANERLEERVAERTRELVQSEKMAAVGQLAAGVAHEINNPIGFVTSNLGTLGNYSTQLLDVIAACEVRAQSNPQIASEVAKITSAADVPFLREDVAALLKESHEGLDRVKRIVQSLQDFAHVGGTEMVDFDVLACLESALTVVGSQLANKGRIVRELSPVPPVHCIPGDINQVFLNLLVNAAQAISEQGTIRLRSGSDGSAVWVEITDDGCGMAPEVRERVFEPFFTTRPVGQGTGLGLAICWDVVVNKHGGRLEVRSAPDAGSGFTVWLPLHVANPA
jgi:hemerythrin-like metal-binding protein